MYLQGEQKYNEFVYLCEEDIHIKKLMLDKMHFSIRQITRIKKGADILTVNGLPLPKNGMIQKGDLISIHLAAESSDYKTQYRQLKTLYEDEDLLIVDKEPFIVVHPTKSHLEDTLLNYVQGYFEQNDIHSVVRFISRLDRDTSGIITIAKNSFSHYALSQGHLSKHIKKYYTAVTKNPPEQKSGTIDLPIFKDGDEIRRKIDERGQRAITHYKVEKITDRFCVIRLLLETGRTHQIRLHLSHIGCPIIGDELYAKETETETEIEKQNIPSSKNETKNSTQSNTENSTNHDTKSNSEHKKTQIMRQALHCSDLELISPRSGKKITVHSDLPNDMTTLINRIL